MNEKFAKGGLICLTLIAALAVIVVSSMIHQERKLMSVINEVVAADAQIIKEVNMLNKRVAALED